MRTSLGARTDTALPVGYSHRMWLVTVGPEPTGTSDHVVIAGAAAVRGLRAALPRQPADSAACGLSAPVATSAMMAMPSAMRYQTNGMKLLLEMNFMNHAMTA